MKYLFTLLLFALTTLGFAQQPLKFGHVDSQALMEALPDVANLQKTMESEYKALESKLTVMQEDLKKMQESYVKVAETLSVDARQAKEKEIMEASQKVQNFYTLSQQQLSAKERELYMPALS